eukprot:9401926-Pyramimonas_sp.AAC.1
MALSKALMSVWSPTGEPGGGGPGATLGHAGGRIELHSPAAPCRRGGGPSTRTRARGARTSPPWRSPSDTCRRRCGCTGQRPGA